MNSTSKASVYFHHQTMGLVVVEHKENFCIRNFHQDLEYEITNALTLPESESWDFRQGRMAFGALY